VACPRAVCPFDESAQSAEYPHEHTRTMVLLADELQTIAQRYRFGMSEHLVLKVGLNCGPVAGAVIGSHRRFYCLYGDRMNTAARMCKYCPAAFAQSVRTFSSA
jgi:class 3 adenylate cyclase